MTGWEGRALDPRLVELDVGDSPTRDSERGEERGSNGAGSNPGLAYAEPEARGSSPQGPRQGGVGPLSRVGGSVLGSWFGVLEVGRSPSRGPRWLDGRVTDGLGSVLSSPPRGPWRGDGRGGDGFVGRGEGSILGSLPRGPRRGFWLVSRGDVSIGGSPPRGLGRGGALTSHGEGSILGSLPRGPWRGSWLVRRWEDSIEGS